MPLTLTLTEGVLPIGQEGALFAELGEAMLEVHGLSQNQAMRRNVVGSVHVLPRDATYSGLEPTKVVFVEWKVPSLAFSDPGVTRRYFEAATEIVLARTGDTIPRDNVYINVVHAVDGAWNFDGKPMTNAEIGQALAT